MRKRVISMVLTLSVIFSLFNPGITTYADNLSDRVDSGELEKVEREEVPETEIETVTSNIMERSYFGESYTLSEEAQAYSKGSDSSNNTDPNYAITVSNDTAVQGTIEVANEMWWYTFRLDKKSTVTLLLNSVEELDADIYLFTLNQESYELEMIGGSAAEGKGVSEYFRHVMEPGIYYFAVAGYESIGGYAFGYYESSIDVGYEINDGMDIATEIKFDENITGVIDGPSDTDWYKITVNKRTIFKYANSMSDEFVFKYVGTDSANGSCYKLMEYKNLYDIKPGTYYFAVYSPTHSYSATKTYTICLEKVGMLCGDEEADLIAIYEEAGFFFQTNKLGTVNYVNGNPVDISYSYHFESLNSAGIQNYNITIDADSDARVAIDWLEGNYYPNALYYHMSTQPAMKVESKPVLFLTYFGTPGYYKINCRGTGAYKQHTLKREDDVEVLLLIDPDTGKLIDIFEFNFFYHHNPSPGNQIITTGPYKTEQLKIWQ